METLRIPAMAMTQSPGREIYAFGVDGKEVFRFAQVFRAGRTEDGTLLGYQRHQVRKHIAEIRSYVESERPMIPNAVVLAFSGAVRFESPTAQTEGVTRMGELVVPLQSPDQDTVGWIVDGQQRLTAISEAQVESFPVFAVAFIAQHDGEQREQFILVNNTRPLPKSLIYELLPGVEAALPTALAQRRLSSVLVDILNNTPGSPLYHVVRQHTNPGGRLRDNSLLKMLENSLSDGLLYRYRLTEPESGQVEGMARLQFAFWAAVQEVWAEIWDLPPRQSRLLHGAGVISLGFLMDAIADRFRDGWPDQTLFVRELERIKPQCHWTEGYWEFGPQTVRRWDEVQNTSSDRRLLGDHLLRLYLMGDR